MFFSSLALSLMAPAICLGMPTKKTAAKLASTIEHKPGPCNNASSFSLLTYNVAGLPEIINTNGIEDKKNNAAYIGKNLREQQYDIIHLQEDFHLHPVISLNDNHTYYSLTSGNVIYGDGLNSFSNYPGSEFERLTWEECALNGGDCLTPKGFTYMTSHMNGLDIDTYNLHADAGNQWLDRKARSMGLDQILRHVENFSNGRPVIIAGDFNDLWTCSKRSINKLTDAGFTDAWVKLHHNGTIPEPNKTANACAHPPKNNSCEVVDKVFYRSGESVNLDAVKFNYDSDIFVSNDQKPLSDHYPVRVDFTWSPKESKAPKEAKKLRESDAVETRDIKVPEEYEEFYEPKEAMNPEQSERLEEPQWYHTRMGVKKSQWTEDNEEKPRIEGSGWYRVPIGVKTPQWTEGDEEKPKIEGSGWYRVRIGEKTPQWMEENSEEQKAEEVEELESEDPHPILYPFGRGVPYHHDV
ncbi:hypothetical protein N0V84_000888 [Fusarium piperis]|uniref:Inositol polyphosphate-related phosphatase domain-containing protein n=1 Tax=Fusarium piperis TaxID=1435070 RepID=A0A9W8WM55_9HYPO|nr:hypothetical protein N0V84_000888 [Fusarium piperis]